MICRFVFLPRWALCVGCFFMALGARAESLPCADSVLSNVLARAQLTLDQRQKDGWAHEKLTVIEQLDGKGKPRSRTEKLYHVTYRGDSPSNQLVKLNGADPSAARAKPNPKRNQDFRLKEDLIKHYTFTVEAREELNHRPTLRLKFVPAADDLPVNQLQDRILNKLQGTVWIDETDSEVAKLDVSLVEKVNVLGGILGNLEHLDLSLTRVRMARGVWFNAHSVMQLAGRKLFDSLGWKSEETARDIHPVTTALR
jgi:hypothetical protein